MIQADNLGLAFGDQAVIQGLDFQISSGQFVSILGPSGCGKTSLLRMIAGLEAPTSGGIRIASDQDSLAPSAAYVFQDPTLLPWRNVLDNVLLPSQLDRSDRANHSPAGGKSDNLQRAKDAIRLVGLAESDCKKYPQMLSGGMRMRVSLARAIVLDPQIMLFDEPFASLDDMLRMRLNEEILRLWSTKRWTGVFVTHNVAEAVYLSQRVLIMPSVPGRPMAEVEIPIEYPRPRSIRTGPHLNQLVDQVNELLQEDNDARSD